MRGDAAGKDSCLEAGRVLTTTWSSLRASQEAMEEQTVKMTPRGQMPSPGGLSQSLKGISITLLLNSEYASPLSHAGPRFSTSAPFALPCTLLMCAAAPRRTALYLSRSISDMLRKQDSSARLHIDLLAGLVDGNIRIGSASKWHICTPYGTQRTKLQDIQLLRSLCALV